MTRFAVRRKIRPSSPKTQSEDRLKEPTGRNRNLGVCLCVTLAFAFCVAVKSAGPLARSHAARAADEQLWRGKYVNFEYGYSLAIPRGLIGVSPPAPWPQHGVDIRLTQDNRAHIFVNADFSASDYPSLDAALDSDLEEVRKNRTNVTIVNRGPQNLGSLKAIGVVLKYKDKTSDETIVEESLTAIRRKRRPEEAILYTIRLKTPEVRYRDDLESFLRVVRSWRLRPLHNRCHPPSIRSTRTCQRQNPAEKNNSINTRLNGKYLRSIVRFSARF